MKLLDIITYFDIFDYSLTKEEIVNFNQINDKEWENLKIESKAGFYFLKGREEILQIRKKRERYAQKLWRKTYLYLRILKYVPFLKMVAVCNTLAFNHPEKNSDIDLFIVTSKNRIWTTRIITTFLLHILGVRRHSNKVSSRFCLSFWCTEKAINLENIQIKPQDPYLMFWCLTLKPVLDNNLYHQFIQENSTWIKNNYDLNFQNVIKTHAKSSPKLKIFKSNFFAKMLEYLLNGKLGNYLENKIKSKLKPRAEEKAKKAGPDSSIIISDQMLKFHNKDKREEIYKKWINQK